MSGDPAVVRPRLIVAALAGVVGLSFFAMTLRSATPVEAEPIPLRDLPLLFVDDTPLAAQSGVVRTFHPARTRSTPVLQAEQPWEGDRAYVYGSVFFDAASQRFRLWYMTNTVRTESGARAPQLRRGGQNLVHLATSVDGLIWEKPALGLHVVNGSAANNVVFDAASPAIVVDSFERDPAKRFKLLAYSHGEYFAAFSPDGTHWSESPKNPVFTGSDTMSMTQDPRTGEFLAYFKKGSEEAAGRVVWLTRSRDFQAWSEPRLVFHADEIDNRWAHSPDQRTDVYDMTVLPHAAGFIGLPAMFRIMTIAPKDAKRSPGQSGQDGPIDIQMVTSADGVTWNRTSPRLNMIPRGAPGTFDAGAILGVSSNSVDVGDETWIYYTGISTTHGAPIPPKRISIGRAVWRRHGFASLDAGAAAGEVQTTALRFATPGLIVNADAARGELRVEVRETTGESIAGLTLAECEPLRANATQWPVRWRSGASVPSDRAVRLRLVFTQARLFSLSAGRGASAQTPPR
jgi:hypothetical protein